MTDNSKISKELRRNISLTGDGAILLDKLHSLLQAQNKPAKVSLTDVVCLALAKLDADLKK